jgi:hypothetical protein
VECEELEGYEGVARLDGHESAWVAFGAHVVVVDVARVAQMDVEMYDASSVMVVENDHYNKRGGLTRCFGTQYH